MYDLESGKTTPFKAEGKSWLANKKLTKIVARHIAKAPVGDSSISEPFVLKNNAEF